MEQKVIINLWRRGLHQLLKHHLKRDEMGWDRATHDKMICSSSTGSQSSQPHYGEHRRTAENVALAVECSYEK